MTFDGFISYSHAADGRLAPAVQRGLHRLAKPWHRRRALWIFRDQTGLSVTPALWSSIQQALDGSGYFVLLASPEAAQSPWVNREIEHWTATKPADRILPVVTDGEWVWDRKTGDFSADSTAVPDALRGAFDEEPLFLDLRWARGDEHLSLHHARFRDAIAQLAAPMHGVSKDELEGEDVRQHRRVKRLRSGAVATLTVLLLVAAMTGVSAVRNADRARDAAAEALRQEQVANEQRGSAEFFAEESKRQQERAVQEQKRAADASALAQQQEELAKDQQMLAELASAEAERQQGLAGEAAERTAEQQKLAQQQSDRAKRLSKKADDLAAEANRQSQLAKDEQKRAEEAADEAARQQANADEQQRIAVSRQLLNKATTRMIDDPATALKFGAAAQSLLPTAETRGAVAGMVASTQWAATKSKVAGAIYALDGSLVTTDLTGRVSLWRADQSAVPLMPNTTLDSAVSDAAGLGLSPDGRILVVLTGGEPSLWNVADRSNTVQLSALPNWRVTSTAFSPDGRMLAIGDGAKVVLWNVSDPARPTKVFSSGDLSDDAVRKVAFSPDGRILMAVQPGEFSAWDVSGPSTPVPLRDQMDVFGLRSFAVSPSSDVVAGWSDEDKPGMLFDLAQVEATPVPPGSIPPGLPDDAPPPPDVLPPDLSLELGELDVLPDSVTASDFSSDGRLLAAGDAAGNVVVWDVSTPAQLRQVTAVRAPGAIRLLELSPDGTRMTGTDSTGNATTWNVAVTAAPDRLAALVPAGRSVLAMAFGRDGRSLSAVAPDADASVWNVADPANPAQGPAMPAHQGEVMTAAYSLDRRTLAAAGEDGRLTLTDVTDPVRPKRLATVDTRLRRPIGLAFSPDGRTLVLSAQETKMQRWDVRDRARPTLRAENTIRYGSGDFLAFSPDGRYLAGQGVQQSAILWDATGPGGLAELATVNGDAEVTSVAFGPDSRTLVTGGDDGKTAVWDISQPRSADRLTTLTGHRTQVTALAFSPDGRTLATGGGDTDTIVWDFGNRSAPTRLASVLGVRGDKVVRLAFSPDGHTLAVAGRKSGLSRVTSVHLWNYAGLNGLRTDPAKFACAIAGGGLDAAGWKRHIPEIPYRETCRR